MTQCLPPKPQARDGPVSMVTWCVCFLHQTVTKYTHSNTVLMVTCDEGHS